jgi:beta-glucanase (GH16 family)
MQVSLQNQAWVGAGLASVDSDGKGFSQQYGYFEMKAKFPPDAPGSWPAFWMRSASGEIDIVESYGVDMTYMDITLHDWTSRTVPAQYFAHVGDLTHDYHTYGLLWTEKRMVFYFDGKQVFATPTPEVMKQPYYLIINLGLGGGWPTDHTPKSFDMQVQYVKAYKQDSTGGPGLAP